MQVPVVATHQTVDVLHGEDRCAGPMTHGNNLAKADWISCR
jgi:hypothetical protein